MPRSRRARPTVPGQTGGWSLREVVMPERREISSAEARALITMVAERLDADGLGAAVAVVDPHGELVAFLRTDGCGLAPITIAINKAFTAARERVESRVLGERSR